MVSLSAYSILWLDCADASQYANDIILVFDCRGKHYDSITRKQILKNCIPSAKRESHGQNCLHCLRNWVTKSNGL